jgi:hypothetical protein
MPDRKILLVEGSDDEHVIKHICGTRNVGVLNIKTQGSVESLLDGFPVRLKESDIEALGLVLDADLNLAGRWAGLRQRLATSGYIGIPENPEPVGTILTPPPNTLLPRFGVWLMPDNRSEGILEDFLRFLIPAGSELFEHARTSVAQIPDGHRLFTEGDLPKALIHTWLAWQSEPGRPFGTAITARFLDPTVAEVDVLVAWLRRLYFPTSAAGVAG